MTEKEKYKVFEFGYGGEFSITHVDATFRNERDAKRVADLLNRLTDENEQLKFENNELKCALALDAVDYIIADGKKIDIPPYYEFENRYKNKKYRREEYDEYW